MSNAKATEASVGAEGETPAQQHVPEVSDSPLQREPSLNTAAQEKVDIPLDLDHVAQLGLSNAAELEKKVKRRLDMTLMPQLWVLYMFNYLNRVNIAQARLNTFDDDLGLQDGDYQVRQDLLCCCEVSF